MKHSTLEKKVNIANDLMYYIYKHIDTYINLDELALEFNINKFYMHKIFKEMFGRNIYETIKTIRLQKSATLLLTNHYSTVTEVANMCGYSSLTSFIPAFKGRFSMTPKEWRKGGYRAYSKQLLDSSPNASLSKASFKDITHEIVKMPEIPVYYLRHKGYENNIRPTWQKLQAWIYSLNITEHAFISLFHDNPAITPLLECQHVACVSLQNKKQKTNNKLPQLTISQGVFAKFDIEGKRGDILKFIHWVYHIWLPQSDFETTTKPAYAIYKKHHHLNQEEEFNISFYLPIA